MFGMPTHDMMQTARKTPALRLAGCCIEPDAWSVECLSCGQRRHLRHADDDTPWLGASGSISTIAPALGQFAESVREALQNNEFQTISPLALWLLLALMSPAVSDSGALSEVLGLPAEQAHLRARELLATPHPAIATAVGGWLAGGAAPAEPLPVALEQLTSRADLDSWVQEKTHGQIKAFPCRIDVGTLLVLATALVVSPRWSAPLTPAGAQMLALDGGFQAITSTTAAGLVAVAKPFSTEGVDVISVIAAPEVSARAVWSAVDEVVGKLHSGALWNNSFPLRAAATGHAWTIREVTMKVPAGASPHRADRRWISRLPRWSATACHDLSAVPGVADVTFALSDRFPPPRHVACAQVATTAYREGGLRASTPTAMVSAAGAPEGIRQTFEQVEVTFDRPHAVLAVSRGGLWEGLPLSQSWVTPTMWNTAAALHTDG